MGFCATGIYPLNDTAIPESAFAHNYVTEEEPSTSILAVEFTNELSFTSAADVASCGRSVDNFDTVMVAGTSNPATDHDLADMLSTDFGIKESPLNDNQQYLCDNSVTVSPEVSFSELMATSKVTKRKIICKKSLSYKAQALSKELFLMKD